MFNRVFFNTIAFIFLSLCTAACSYIVVDKSKDALSCDESRVLLTDLTQDENERTYLLPDATSCTPSTVR
ncbi:MAG TPA: hypothetical protein VHZ76_04270 [Gammaproteobacteria bacterium]|jgi:hypothetical protein|nr:hypothetical protein [Gammaproteobacteria bacterium]